MTTRGDKEKELLFIKHILDDAHIFRAHHIDNTESLFGAPHSHADRHHLSYIVSGRARARIGRRSLSLPEGSMIFVPAGISHSSFPVSGNDKLALMEVKFSVRGKLSFDWTHALVKTARGDVHGVFNRLINDFYMQRPHREVMMRVCLAQLIIAAMRARSDSGRDAHGIRKIPASAVKERLEKAVDYIRQNYASHIGLADIAAAAGMSSSHFGHRFREHMGVSPFHYLIKLRLNHALRLMESTDLTLDAIAEKVGMSNVYYFSRLFKKHYGVAPRTYAEDIYQKQESAK